MLDSLVHQTIGLDALQLLFIDDKSTDNSAEIVEKYLQKYSSIEFYQLKENTGGAHGPRNVGILNARGEYLVFLDADDWYDENALQYMSETLDKSNDDMGFFGIAQSINGKQDVIFKSFPLLFMSGWVHKELCYVRIWSKETIFILSISESLMM